MAAQEKKKKAIPKPTHFGKNLRFLRRLNGLSQGELANQLGIKRNNIASYESGAAEPSAKVCLKICRLFNKAPKEILDSLMIDQKIESSNVILPESSEVRQEQFDILLKQFVDQTNEMTKILEGYTSLIELKNDNTGDKISRQLYSSFTDLLDLLNTLIRLNWDFMQTATPSDLTD